VGCLALEVARVVDGGRFGLGCKSASHPASWRHFAPQFKHTSPSLPSSLSLILATIACQHLP
jgi:hypothetical protein